MSPLNQAVEALGREINRLWAKQNPPGTPQLVPLPPKGDRLQDNGVSLQGEGGAEVGARYQQQEEPAGEG